MRVLVLGGTAWLGGAVAAEAVARGHRVTCLARGESGPAPQRVEFVGADRWEPGAYDAVAGRTWDAVVEVSWQPELVGPAVAALASRAGHWTYVSSLSVYRDDSVPDADESAAVHEPWTGTGAVPIEQYGPGKVACERAVLAGLGERSLVVRAGLITGGGDRSDRFGYWPARIARAAPHEPVLTPQLDSPVQMVDALDLAGWIMAAAERSTVGVYNAVGDQTTLGEVLAAAAEATHTRPEPVEVDDDWLVEQHVEPWMGPESLPLWLPRGKYDGFMRRRNEAARRAGLTFRPLTETVAAALTWELELGLGRERRAGLSPDREAALLATWRQRAS